MKDWEIKELHEALFSMDEWENNRREREINYDHGWHEAMYYAMERYINKCSKLRRGKIKRLVSWLIDKLPANW